LDSSKSLKERGLAALSVASEALPVSIGDVKDVYKGVKAGINKLDDVASSRKLLSLLTTARLPRDAAADPNPPSATTSGTIGKSSGQNAELQRDIGRAQAQKTRDIRVNQQQVNASGHRVGVNRPDLQYTRQDGTRVYVEYDKPSGTNSSRGRRHANRILANDPDGVVELKTIN
jgi:hypothetical protein